MTGAPPDPAHRWLEHALTDTPQKPRIPTWTGYYGHAQSAWDTVDQERDRAIQAVADHHTTHIHRIFNTYIWPALAHDQALIEDAFIRAITTTSTGVLVLYHPITHRVISAEPCDQVPAYEIHERIADDGHRAPLPPIAGDPG